MWTPSSEALPPNSRVSTRAGQVQLLKPKDLRTREDLRERKEWDEEERLRIRAISFAAAALCLSFDLGLKIPEESSRDDLIEIILGWHTLISKLISAVDDT